MPVSKATLARVLKWLGNGLALFGVILVATQLWQHGGDLKNAGTSFTLWLLIIVSSIVYAIAALFLVFAWKNILRHLGDSIPTRVAFSIYGVSQLAKYAPGNVFHLAGRQALGLSQGIPGWSLAKSTVIEIALIFIAGFSSVTLVISWWLPGVTWLASAMLFLLCTALIAVLLRALFSTWLARAYWQQVVFLLVSGLIFACLLNFLGEPADGVDWRHTMVVVGVFILAWTVGLVTPGAPAGAGVRELVLLAGLNGLAPDEVILAAVLISRIITIIGDLLFFAMAAATRPEQQIDE
jgi:hypothetical protein